jgi:hypothetical protein
MTVINAKGAIRLFLQIPAVLVQALTPISGNSVMVQQIHQQ